LFTGRWRPVIGPAGLPPSRSPDRELRRYSQLRNARWTAIPSFHPSAAAPKWNLPSAASRLPPCAMLHRKHHWNRAEIMVPEALYGPAPEHPSREPHGPANSARSC